MTPAALPAPAALPDRLQSYARFVTVVAEQLQALQQHDTVRLRALAEERARLEEELREAGTLVESGLQLLDEDELRARQETELWTEIESRALRAARSLAAAAPRAGTYAELAPAETHVDVRF